MDLGKIEAVDAWPRPRMVRALRGFLSALTMDYRKFIANYGAVAAPITTLAFRWSDDAEHAFPDLNKALTSTPLL